MTRTVLALAEWEGVWSEEEGGGDEVHAVRGERSVSFVLSELLGSTKTY